MHKRTVRTAIIYTLSTLFSFTITMMIMGLLTLLLLQTDLPDNIPPFGFFIVFSIVCIITGTIIGKFMGNRMIHSIVEINKATIEVANGNFSVHLDEKKHRAKEMNSMVKNFNQMVDELNSTELLRNDFIENVSHEFKTPLSAIEGYATLLQDSNLSDETKELYTEQILSNTKRLSSLSSNILLISKIDHQEIPEKNTLFSLDEELREAILPFENQWLEKKVELNIDLDNISYWGNKELLAQVWQNLIGNALKFVKENGTIRIILRKTDAYARIDIVDNGIGMSKETINRIFEKFYQADRSRSISGNGLGLTLVKRIIDLHEGSIDVSSIEGKGTTFTILLPIRNL